MKIEQIINMKNFEFEPITNSEMKTLLRDFDSSLEKVYIEYRSSFFMTKTKALIRMQSVVDCYKSTSNNLFERIKETNPKEANQFLIETINIQIKYTSKFISHNTLKAAMQKCYDNEIKHILIKTPKTPKQPRSIEDINKDIKFVEGKLEAIETEIKEATNRGEFAKVKRCVDKYEDLTNEYEKLFNEYCKASDEFTEICDKETKFYHELETEASKQRNLKTQYNKIDVERELEILKEIKQLEIELNEIRKNRN